MFFSAERFKKIRIDSGLNKTEFAKTLDISTAYVIMIEKGDRVPKDGVIRILLDHHSVNKTWWETGSGDMHPPPEINERGANYSPNKIHSRLLDAFDAAEPTIQNAALTMLENSAKELRRNVGGGSDCGESKSAQN